MSEIVCDQSPWYGKEETKPNKAYLLYKFPDAKKAISKLSNDQKLEWYQYQFEISARIGQIPVELTTADFKKFWKWNFYIPLRIKRLYYRIKNREIFKHYPHITEMRAKVKKHSI